MVDTQMRVVREDGTLIPGLYASGELTGFAGVNGSIAPSSQRKGIAAPAIRN